MDAEVTRAAIVHAASGLFSGRVRNAGCDFLQSHRDGPCAKCVERDAHDRELAAKAT